MKEQERIELLKQVADCAPEWMQAYPINGGVGFGAVHASYWNCDNPTKADAQLNLLFDDISNAPAIVAMLDAMEKAGLTPALSITAADDAYRYEVAYAQYGKRCDSCGTYGYTHLEFHGATRAEAVARAFVRVFGEQP